MDCLDWTNEVIAEVFPSAQHQLCVLHMLRQWLAKVRKQDRKRISNLLGQMLIEADNPQHAQQLLQVFVQQYGRTYPSIVRSLQQRFQALTVHLRYPSEIRRLIYTNNPVESPFGADASFPCAIHGTRRSAIFRPEAACLRPTKRTAYFPRRRRIKSRKSWECSQIAYTQQYTPGAVLGTFSAQF